ncbi:MAG: vanadium-dependent haloperoxidase, partial [Saprospiraceae bacterium]
LAWSAKDTYKESRSYPKYTITDDPAKWRPTPPDYMDGIEPSWNKIRPFVMDSCSQFKPEPPTPFSLDKNSQFYKELMEVYQALNVKNKEECIEIAKFWDCNPYVSHHAGHVTFATKKITPGGHWMGITAIAARQAKADFLKTAEAYTLTSLALVDGFISCWDEKYRSQMVRPETVINENIDPDWRPLLQTPPFPEYTSGHSVISSAAAVALTSIFGDNFAFTDTTEEEFGLPARQFKSFIAASEEAAISRMYGGIHYRPAIENGVKQGRQVGEWVVKKVHFKKGDQQQLSTTK